MANADAKDNERFKLPGSSLDEIFKVIQGYASVNKMASLSDISKNTGMHVTAISKNVGFLLSTGILEGGKNKAPTDIGKKLGLALMHNVPEQVESILADIVSEDEFLKNVLAAVRIRKGMDESALRAHIAYSAGQSKTGSTTTGTGAVVELLKRSGHLKAEDGKLVVSSPDRTPSDPTPQERITPVAGPVKSISQTIEAASPFSITIKIEVRCEPKDLDDLGVKLRKIVDDFSEHGAVDADED
jgi:hypothetical protein